MANIMIIDTETANSVNQPLPYDIGYQIIDNDSGETLVERSFVVAEIFLDKDLMTSAYYAEKVPKYWDDIKAGKRQMKKLLNIRKIIWADMKEFDCYHIGAYNMGFDKKATNNNTRYITASFLRWFFPYKATYFCIWNMACSSILSTPGYINFCKRHGFISPSGNIQTSAEVVYKYITNNPDYKEQHTGLEDVKIEKEIYIKCLDSGMKYDDTISFNCWRKVQKFRKEYELSLLENEDEE